MKGESHEVPPLSLSFQPCISSFQHQRDNSLKAALSLPIAGIGSVSGGGSGRVLSSSPAVACVQLGAFGSCQNAQCFLWDV
jgi:hypothetical protein